MSDLLAVAMSGGLDSSVAAWLLAREGQPVVGLSMLLWEQAPEAAAPGAGRCCGALDLGDARQVAAQIGIPHYTLRMDAPFRRDVVDPFVADYLAGRTPSPCVRCNTLVKFGTLLDRARTLGAQKVATGHYARIVEGPDGLELHRGRDTVKDQSYFLFELTREQLARSRFPLGERSKEEVRGLARSAALCVAEKGESMEVCFVSSSIRGFVEEQVGEHPRRFPGARMGAPARIVDSAGQPLGTGEPYYRYTVGQRRGVGVAGSRRRYVLRVLAEENQVVVGEEAELLRPGLRGERLHWIGTPPEGPLEATVRIRARHPGVAAQVRALPGQGAEVVFASPQRGVAPGQAAVFYHGTRVLGGCWIAAAL
jgi:tRNA-uridine 2-sulfurtransferase